MREQIHLGQQLIFKNGNEMAEVFLVCLVKMKKLRKFCLEQDIIIRLYFYLFNLWKSILNILFAKKLIY